MQSEVGHFSLNILGLLGFTQKVKATLENSIIKLGRGIHTILVIEYWSLQKSILRTGKEWHRFRFRDKKLSEMVTYTRQNSDHNKI